MHRSNRHLLLTSSSVSWQKAPKLLSEAGFLSTPAPLLDFVGCTPWQGKPLGDYLAGFDLIIAMSPRAPQFCRPDRWPNRRYFAVGQSSARLWQQAGLWVELASPSNSEGMLQTLRQLPNLNELQILLLRGTTSRGWLGPQLSTKVKQFSELCCYHQKPLPITAATLQQWVDSGVNSIVCNSQLQLNTLVQAVIAHDQQHWLHDCDLFVPSERVSKSHIDFNFRHVYNCQGADIHALMATLETLV